MAGRTWQAGDVMADRYRLEVSIGRGAVGEVYRAEHTRLRTPIAVKLLHPREGTSDGLNERFLREAQASAAIGGPNVVAVSDFGFDRGTPYLAMELLSGESLAQRLVREPRLSPATSLDVLTQVSRAVARAHRRGIVHRDLKPSNVYLAHDEDQSRDQVKVLDFGIAKVLEGAPSALVGATLTETGVVLGTTQYMSPEQARGTKEVDHRSDLWALSILGFQCLTGRLPYEAASHTDLLIAIATQPMPKPSEIARELPPSVDAWFARGTRRSPDDRFQTATEFAEELARALA